MSEFDKIFTEQEMKSKSYPALSKLLENSYKNIKQFNPNFTIDEAISYATGGLGDINDFSSNGLFHKISMGLSKRTWDRLIAREIVGVQPMSGPVGLYYALRYYANGLYGGVNNQELGFNKVDSTFTGSVVTSAGEQLGSDTITNIGLGIGNNTQQKELNIKLEKKQVEAQSRYLRARFTEELFQDVFSMHDCNLRDQLYTGIAREISTEIDLEIIDKINTVATAKTLDFASVAGDNKSDKYNSFVAYVLNLANVIGKETNHGNGNFVIASSNISGVIESTPQFSVSMITDKQMEWDDRVCFAGTINGIKVYRNIFWDTEKYIVGYKGGTELDAGIFYLPYIFLSLQALHENSFQNSVGVLTRYAIGESIFGAEKYYQKVDVSNMDVLYS